MKTKCSSPTQIFNVDKGPWEDIEKVLAQANALDFPHRTHEEIIRDLHELRRIG